MKINFRFFKANLSFSAFQIKCRSTYKGVNLTPRNQIAIFHHKRTYLKTFSLKIKLWTMKVKMRSFVQRIQKKLSSRNTINQKFKTCDFLARNSEKMERSQNFDGKIFSGNRFKMFERYFETKISRSKSSRTLQDFSWDFVIFFVQIVKIDKVKNFWSILFWS